MEIELKFGLDPAAVKGTVAALKRLPGAGEPATHRLDARYFDTPANDLCHAGLTLRLRSEDGRQVQTVKSGDTIARGEWKDVIDGRAPDLAMGKSGRKIRRALKDVKKDALSSKFSVKVTRTVIAIITKGAVIEAAVDRGFIQTDGRQERLPVAELELELKSGADVSALYDLALVLAEHLPLRLEGQSKSARGYALAAGAVTQPVKAKRVPLREGATLAEALRDAGRVYLSQFASNMSAVRGNSVEGVHQMRVALRRLRGVLKATQALLPPPEYAWVNQRFKHVLQELGPARNWDVLTETLRDAPDLPHRRTAAQRRLREAVEAERRKAHTRAAKHMQSPAVTRTMLEIARWFERLPALPGLDDSVTATAPKALDRAFKRLRKKGRGYAALSTEDRHKLRIAGKNMRYAVELFGPLYGARATRTFLRSLKDQQDLLGALNDIHGAHALLQPLAKGSRGAAVGEVLGWLDHKATALDAGAAKVAGKVRKSGCFW